MSIMGRLIAEMANTKEHVGREVAQRGGLSLRVAEQLETLTEAVHIARIGTLPRGLRQLCAVVLTRRLRRFRQQTLMSPCPRPLRVFHPAIPAHH